MVTVNLKAWQLIVIVGTIVAVIVASTLVYLFYMQAPSNSEWNISDQSNDVDLNAGTEYPGMIDIVKVTLVTNGNELKFTIDVRDPISSLSEGQHAQWNITTILEDDVLKAYEISADLNSTGLTCYIVELGETNVTLCQVTYSQNSITITATVPELQSAKDIQWFVLTTYESYSGADLVTSASDLAPDEGLQTTILKT
jgi:hypothetical protein